MHFPSRGGVRGGSDQFEWESVKTDKHRENYLGHSLMAPVGRWQKGKDLTWYAKDKESKVKQQQMERSKVKQLEEEAMAAALGFGTVKKRSAGLTKQEITETLKRGQTERDSGNVERVEGMGFGSSRAAMMDTTSASNDFFVKEPESKNQKVPDVRSKRSDEEEDHNRKRKKKKKHNDNREAKKKKKKKKRREDSNSRKLSGKKVYDNSDESGDGFGSWQDDGEALRRKKRKESDGKARKPRERHDSSDSARESKRQDSFVVESDKHASRKRKRHDSDSTGEEYRRKHAIYMESCGNSEGRGRRRERHDSDSADDEYKTKNIAKRENRLEKTRRERRDGYAPKHRYKSRESHDSNSEDERRRKRLSRKHKESDTD